MTFRLTVASPIRVYKDGNDYFTDPLWARDLVVNTHEVRQFRLLCPIQTGRPSGELAPLDPSIIVTDANTITSDGYDELARNSDVVQVVGNFPWSKTSTSRRLAAAARRHGVLTILGISSNRAKTAVMNARGRRLHSRLRARATAFSIRANEIFLARRCDAVRLVGEGLRPLVEGHAEEIRVEVASWITEADLRPRGASPSVSETPPLIVIASRLEAMKGVANGVDACAQLSRKGHDFTLEIAGVGAEEERLRQRVAQEGLDDRVRLIGQLPYPRPFLDKLGEAEFVLLTNLNDELPRLIFDAISQGAIPVCPASGGYLSLGLDERVLYERGSVSSLRDTLERLLTMPITERDALRDALMPIARTRTIESMHAARRAWTEDLLAAQRARAG